MTQRITINEQTVASNSVNRVPRASIEQLLRYAPYVSISDRSMLQAVYHHGMTPTALARAMGQYPKTIRTRLHRLIKRIGSPEFRFVVEHQRNWPADRRAIAEAVILHGNTHRAAAAMLNTTVYRVRHEVDAICAQCEGRRMLACV